MVLDKTEKMKDFEVMRLLVMSDVKVLKGVVMNPGGEMNPLVLIVVCTKPLPLL